MESKAKEKMSWKPFINVDKLGRKMAGHFDLAIVPYFRRTHRCSNFSTTFDRVVTRHARCDTYELADLPFGPHPASMWCPGAAPRPAGSALSSDGMLSAWPQGESPTHGSRRRTQRWLGSLWRKGAPTKGSVTVTPVFSTRLQFTEGQTPHVNLYSEKEVWVFSISF